MSTACNSLQNPQGHNGSWYLPKRDPHQSSTSPSKPQPESNGRRYGSVGTEQPHGSPSTAPHKTATPRHGQPQQKRGVNTPPAVIRLDVPSPSHSYSRRFNIIHGSQKPSKNAVDSQKTGKKTGKPSSGPEIPSFLLSATPVCGTPHSLRGGPYAVFPSGRVNVACGSCEGCHSFGPCPKRRR